MEAVPGLLFDDPGLAEEEEEEEGGREGVVAVVPRGDCLAAA